MSNLSNPKNIFALLIFSIAVVFYYNFTEPFRLNYLEPISSEYENLSAAFVRAKDQLSLDALKTKKNQLSLQEVNILENFVPIRLKSGTFVYNLAQYANQNRLILKSIQYSVVDEGREVANVKTRDKRLVMEFTLDGRYEDFAKWLSVVENANTLISVESVRGVRNSVTSDIITFNVKLVTYALDID
jgi:Tfp pilus assembly protein PilO